MHKKKKKHIPSKQTCPTCDYGIGQPIESDWYDYQCDVCECRWDIFKHYVTGRTERGSLNAINVAIGVLWDDIAKGLHIEHIVKWMNSRLH